MSNPEFTLAAVLPNGYTVHSLAEVDSTNSAAQRWLAAGNVPQALFIAERQTSGRGRRERAWDSPNGNLYASLVVPCPQDKQRVGHYGFQISLAIYAAVKALDENIPIAVKWPNDVLISQAKCAGILIEWMERGLVIGFGVNIACKPAQAAYESTRLDDWCQSESPLVWCQRIMQAFSALADLSPKDLLARWRAAAVGVGQPITVKLPYTTLQGVFKGLEDDGGLQLVLPDNSVKRIYSGEVFFGNASV